MSKRYTVAESTDDRIPEFTYPADPTSLQTIRNAGGLSKMTDEAREMLKFKTVKTGDDCTDMPEPARSIYVDRGWVLVEEVITKDEPKTEVKK